MLIKLLCILKVIYPCYQKSVLIWYKLFINIFCIRCGINNMVNKQKTNKVHHRR